MQNLYQRARQIRLAVFDVDGVLTDGPLSFGSSGEELKVFNVLDGHGMKMLQESGVTLAVITSRASRAVEERMRNLGIGLVFQGALDKLTAFNQLLAQQQVAADAVSCMGDDLQDVP